MRSLNHRTDNRIISNLANYMTYIQNLTCVYHINYYSPMKNIKIIPGSLKIISPRPPHLLMFYPV